MEEIYQYEIIVGTNSTEIPQAVAEATEKLIRWDKDTEIIETNVIDGEDKGVSFIIATTEEDMERFYDDMMYGFEGMESVQRVPITNQQLNQASVEEIAEEVLEHLEKKQHINVGSNHMEGCDEVKEALKELGYDNNPEFAKSVIKAMW